ncbi:MAG: lipid A deacylase LpxR family protein [Hyphomonadaceae bacterium]
MRIWVAALAVFCCCGQAAAQEFGDGWNFSVVHENDLFESGHDRDYTAGELISATSQRGALDGIVEDIVEATPFEDDFTSDVRMEIALSHAMFTPEDISRAQPDPRDRPYAGMALISVGFMGADERRFDRVNFSAGVVGPSSQADDIQIWLHEQIEGVRPAGWAAQIPDRIVAGVEYQQTRLVLGGADGHPYDVFAHGGFSLGSIQTNASVGVSVRVGHNRPRDFGLPRLAPSLPGSGYFTAAHSWGWYAFAGAEGRYVAYDVTLDEGPSVGPKLISRRDWVGDLQAGAALYIGRVRVSYSHIWRSEQFRGQREGDGFGAVAVTLASAWGA